MKVYVDAFLFQNLGDDLFVDLLVKRYPNTSFITCSHYYEANKSNIKVINDKLKNKIFDSERVKLHYAKKCDLIVYIGGSMFIEGVSKPSKLLDSNKDCYVVGCNFGPYHSKKYVDIHRKLFANLKDICFRDNYSYELFEDLDSTRKASDIVFTLNYPKVESEKLVVISMIDCHDDLLAYREAYEQKMVELYEHFIKDGYKVCFMSFCQLQHDEEAIERVLKHAPLATSYYYRGNREEALKQLAKASFIVGTRFHANILGLVLNKPILPICYSNKTLNVLNDIGYQGKIINLKDIDAFLVEELNEKDYNYIVDVQQMKKEAEMQFSRLDEVLK